MTPITGTLGRVPGLDLARAGAMFGMTVVNFELALGATGTGPPWLGAITAALQGRAAATFVVLAGIGVSLAAARARRSAQPGERAAARRRIARRGLALFALGAAFQTVWPADILHFYGAYFLLGAALVFAPGRVIWGAMALVIVLAAAYLASGAWPERWDLATLTYRGFWTVSGFTRNLVLDGWHPVLPWSALFLYGLWLGRATLADPGWLRRAGLIGAGVFLALEVLGRQAAPQGVDTPGAAAFLATSCFPPTPAYVVAASGLATAVIAVSAEFAARGPQGVVRALEATGRIALTFYLAHVLVGLGALAALGRMEGQTLPFALGAAVVFGAASVLFAVAWTKHFQRGPLEALLRRVDGSTARRTD